MWRSCRRFRSWHRRFQVPEPASHGTDFQSGRTSWEVRDRPLYGRADFETDIVVDGVPVNLHGRFDREAVEQLAHVIRRHPARARFEPTVDVDDYIYSMF